MCVYVYVGEGEMVSMKCTYARNGLQYYRSDIVEKRGLPNRAVRVEYYENGANKVFYFPDEEEKE